MTRINCLAAKHNLLADTDGKIKLCCNSPVAIGSIGDPLDHVMKSQVREEVIQSLDKGQWPSACNRCYEEEKNGTRSYRFDYNDMYSEFDDEQESKIKTLHIQSDNTCNLTCVYCGPRYSSKWQGKIHAIAPKKNRINIDVDSIKNLEMITLTGGEPALIKPYTELVKKIVEINPKCQIVVNTNLTHYHDSELFRILEKHRNTKIIVSFESTESKFEYIRYHSSWNVFENNFRLATERNETVESSMILFPLSISSIIDAIEFSKSYTSEDRIFVNDYFGNHFKWEDIGSKSLARAKDKLVQYSKTLSDRLCNDIGLRIDKATSSKLRTNIEFLENFDKQNKIDHKLIFPELYE